MTENTLEKSGETRIVDKTSAKPESIIIKIVVAALFGSLSLMLSFNVASLPRVQWGLALFDPVSIVWVAAAMIFGFSDGFYTACIGFLLLLPFDPWTPLGPAMKFAATIPLIIIPWINSKIRNFKSRKESFAIKQVAIDWTIAVVVRNIIMLIFNYIVITLMFGDAFINGVTLEFIGLPKIQAWPAIIATVVLINTLQSVWDYFIPLSITQTILRNNKILGLD